MRKTNGCKCLLLPLSAEITVISQYFPPEYSREGKACFTKSMMMGNQFYRKHYCLHTSIPWGTIDHVYKTGCAVARGFRARVVLSVLFNSASFLSLHTQIIIIQFLARSNFIFLIIPDILSPISH